MLMKIYTVDAFTDTLFGGNPAAVCPLNKWLTDEMMQKIAFENNLAETAFIVQEQEGYRIRWFTPATEVELCGHATLASAHVFFNHLKIETDTIIFNSLSGPLAVTKNGALLTLNFPADVFQNIEQTQKLRNCFSIKPVEILKGKTDYMFVFNKQKNIENIAPKYDAIAQLTDARGVIITAPGNEVDFVSRFFAPQSGINEDPVTGSAHTTLTPYWSKNLNKTKFNALQLSERKGKLHCELLNNRVLISGQAVTYMIGDIQL
ncbi:MAG: PhzF family phenazine biosynthesis protein [Bacteroidetes bacterium]|nr:PhzF family phenazine biosynthesis protein [Bacteroidota bacterium]